jgi:hypothetical protein
MRAKKIAALSTPCSEIFERLGFVDAPGPRNRVGLLAGRLIVGCLFRGSEVLFNGLLGLL